MYRIIQEKANKKQIFFQKISRDFLNVKSFSDMAYSANLVFAVLTFSRLHRSCRLKTKCAFTYKVKKYKIFT